MNVQGSRSSADGFRNRRWPSVLTRLRWLVRSASSFPAGVHRFIRAAADFASGDLGFVAVAILSFVVGLGVCWFPASESRQENEPVPCLRVVEVVRLAETVPKSRGSILVVRIERAPGHRSIELHPGGEATCDPAELDLPIPPVPNVVFRRRGLFFEPQYSPRRRASPRIPIPVEKTNRLTESNPTHGTSRETT